MGKAINVKTKLSSKVCLRAILLPASPIVWKAATRSWYQGMYEPAGCSSNHAPFIAVIKRSSRQHLHG